MNKIVKLVAPVAVIAGGIIAVMAMAEAKEAPEKVNEPPRPTSLYVDDVRSDTVTLAVTTQGEVKAKTQIDLIPQVSGRIVNVSESFAAGGEFSPNQMLIEIDDADYRLAFTRAEARVAEAEVRLEQELADAKIKAQQWKDWVHEGEPTPLALNKPQVAEAQAKLRAAQADLSEARLNMERTKISVPFPGRVLSREVGLGQYVNAGTKLGSVFATNTVEIKLPLTDKQLAELNMPIGFNASANKPAPNVTLTATVGGDIHTWSGKIVRTHAAVDKQTRLFYAVAEVNDPYGAGADEDGMPLAVGMFVSANIEGVNAQNALIMPRDALRGDDQVYVIEDDILHIRTVDIIYTSDTHIYVSSGVEAGEKVVTSPVRTAYNGMEATAITRNAKADSTSAPASSQ
ncbi:MexH family multidrug efflux RND transporter periplasmic adaptor subunit [Kordiimonas sediminis]|uniref:MexH family multidrug efflux RND transporter periplasmic adaptor subunit n=1 Tax=Kordiimonas sediminis TaxID=1735581 RepID=A0A919E7G4_9PROT|nr:efflux RND transporter periplasmic adaptor subunit [Kordiimonas sediminis]GHF20909.1 MexH family multidrug efflux RND transporter periplasmic adaptor subunit [Kordiimonas sediminis]